MKFILTVILMLFAFSCTKNQRAKKWGGTAEMNLPKGQKLINCTWKDSDLWYLMRPMTVNDTACTYTFQEQSSFGLFSGDLHNS